MQFSLYRTAGTTRKSADITLAELLQAVRDGKHKNRSFTGLITTIRGITDKKERDRKKKNLPAVTLSGSFPADSREEKNILQHSGLIQVDFDELPDMADICKRLAADPYTFLCFLSPSGTGVKLGVQIPIENPADFEALAADHRRSFFALEQYYRDAYGLTIDTKCKDASRLLFLSYDPGIYCNELAAVYTEKREEPTPAPKATAEPAPLPAETFGESKLFLPDQSADVENVIAQITTHGIDITGTYEEWLSIAFALSAAFGENGREYFHDVSRFYSGYDRVAADQQYTEAAKQRKGGGVSLKTFFHIAKQYGIDTRSPTGKRTPDKPKLKTPQPPAAQVTEQEQAPEPQPVNSAALDSLKTPIAPECEDTNGHFLKQYEFYYTDSSYYIEVFINRKKTEQRISNFIMQFLYFFPDGSNNAKRLIKLQNKDGHIELIELYAKELASVTAFKSAVSSKGNFFFSGTQSALDKIMEYHSMSAQTAHTIAVLGWQRQHSIYAFSNGIINAENAFIAVDALGMVRDGNKSYFLPALSPLNEHATSFTNEQRFLYLCGDVDFTTFAELLYTAYGDNAAVSVAYMVAAVVRDIIFAHLSSFPFLFLFGEAGAGKTSFTDIHLALFGRPQAGIALSSESTTKSIARKLSQLSNALMYLKEYSNSIAPTTIGLLKTAWEGVGYDRAQTTNDNRTHQTGVYSGLIIDGNELPEKNSALFSRCFALGFEKNEFTEEQTKAFKKLKAAAAAGLGQVFHEIHRQRYTIKQNFAKTYAEILYWLKGERCAGMNLAERTLEHIALLMAPVRILEKTLSFHISSLQLSDILIALSGEQTRAMKQTNEVQVFFAALEFLSSERRIFDGRHYRFIKEDTGRVVLSLAFARVYPLYVEHCRRQGVEPTGRMSLIALLKGRGYFIQSVNAKAGDTTADKILSTSCYRFDYAAIGVALDKLVG